MTPKARFFARQKAPLSCTTRIKIDEDIVSIELAERDPNGGAAWAEDRFVAYEPEEIEVLDVEEVKADLGVESDGVYW